MWLKSFQRQTHTNDIFRHREQAVNLRVSPNCWSLQFLSFHPNQLSTYHFASVQFLNKQQVRTYSTSVRTFQIQDATNFGDPVLIGVLKHPGVECVPCIGSGWWGRLSCLVRFNVHVMFVALFTACILLRALLRPYSSILPCLHCSL